MDFGILKKEVFKADISMCLKKEVVNPCILPVFAYGMETLTLKKNRQSSTNEHGTVHSGHSMCHKFPNETI